MLTRFVLWFVFEWSQSHVRLVLQVQSVTGRISTIDVSHTLNMFGPCLLGIPRDRRCKWNDFSVKVTHENRLANCCFDSNSLGMGNVKWAIMILKSFSMKLSCFVSGWIVLKGKWRLKLTLHEAIAQHWQRNIMIRSSGSERICRKEKFTAKIF